MILGPWSYSFRPSSFTGERTWLFDSKFRPKSEGLAEVRCWCCHVGLTMVWLHMEWKVRQKSSYNDSYCLDTKCITFQKALGITYSSIHRTARGKKCGICSCHPKNVLLQLYCQFCSSPLRCGLSMSLLKYFPPRDGMDSWMVVELLESGGRNHVEENNTSAPAFLESNVQLQDRSATCAQETTLDMVVLMLYEMWS